jgi:23S rRNA (adenine2503-C2)-methyltransferase
VGRRAPPRYTAPVDAAPHPFGLRPEQLADAVDASVDEARRIQAHLISEGRIDLSGMKRPVRRVLRERVEGLLEGRDLEVVERVTDPTDGFVKLLLRSPDGALTEAVRIPLHKPGRYSVCLSSQVGCAMQCAFCATGTLGLTRHLAAWEMVAAFRRVAIELRAEEPGARLSGAVFQGQGEPFHNYEAVVQAASVINHPCGGRVSADAITISTVGLVEKIRRFTREGHPYRLIVSLTSAVPERRRELLPVAGRLDLEDLAEVLRERSARVPGRVTVAWVLLGGVNHDAAEVDRLKALLGDLPLRVNLIDVNGDLGFRRATDDERNAFFDRLQALEVPIVRRYSGGRGTHAACGMLAKRRADA